MAVWGHRVRTIQWIKRTESGTYFVQIESDGGVKDYELTVSRPTEKGPPITGVAMSKAFLRDFDFRDPITRRIGDAILNLEAGKKVEFPLTVD